MRTKAGLLLIIPLLILPLVHQTVAEDGDNSSTACGYSPGIEASSRVNTVDDPIILHVGGLWSDSCVPTYHSHAINGNIIRVDALWDSWDTFCLPVLTGWGFQIDLGTLPADTYQTELYVTHFGTSLCHTNHFHVFEQIFQQYLPVISKTE